MGRERTKVRDSHSIPHVRGKNKIEVERGSELSERARLVHEV